MSPLFFNMCFTVVHTWMAFYAPLNGIDIGLPARLRAIYYADDVVLLADSVAQLQGLLSCFESCCAAMHMVVNPDKSNVVVFSCTGSGATDNLVPILSRWGIIQPASSYCYLGIMFTSHMRWEAALQHRDGLASSSQESLLSYLQANRLYDMRVAAVHFNANVLQTMLFGCAVWGWQYFLSWDPFVNSFQTHQAQLLKAVLKLPRSTPTIVLMLESGVWPMMMYAMRQAIKFVHNIPQAKSHTLTHLVHHPQGAQRGRGILQQYHKLLSFISSSPSHLPSQQLPQVLQHVQAFFAHSLQTQAAEADPRQPNAPHRKVATYLRWVWDGKLHKSPAFYSIVDMHPCTYRTCIRVRTMNASIPAQQQCSSPFLQRACPLCNCAPCDLQHILQQCTVLHGLRMQFASLVGYKALSFPGLLQSQSAVVWDYVAQALQPFHWQLHCATSRKRGRNTGAYEDDPDWRATKR
jgi:hypothetical protein